MIGKLRTPLPGWQDSLARYLGDVAERNSGSLAATKRKAICRAAQIHVADLPRRAPALCALFSSFGTNAGSEFQPTPRQQEVIQALPDLPLSGEDDLLILLAGVEFAETMEVVSAAREQARQARQQVSEQQQYVGRLERTLADLKAERDQLHSHACTFEQQLAAKDELLAERTEEVVYFEKLTEMLSRSGLNADEGAQPARKRRERVEGHPGIYQRKTLAGTVYEVLDKKQGQTTYVKAGNSLEAAIRLRAELRGEKAEKVLD